MIVAALFLAAAQPQTVLTVDPKHRLVEGIASDGSTIWLSSIIDRQLLACRSTCETLVTLPAGLHPFAIAWDSKRSQLWVAAGCPPGVPFIVECDRGALLGIDRTGRIRTWVAPMGGAFQPGDASAANGQVFVSDSQNGAVYRLAPGGKSLLTLVAPGVGKSGQGLALSANGKTLLVADYSQGIASVSFGSGARTLLPRQDGKPLRGVDGLVRCGDYYYGIYNGSSPGRIVTFVQTRAGIHFGNLYVGNMVGLADPTQIAFDGKRLLVVADSGWELAGKGTPRTEGAPILAIPLGPDCKPK